MEQIGGHVLTDPAAHQLHRAAEGFPLAPIPHHVQITRAGGPAEIEVVAAGRISHQIQLQTRPAHVAPHGSVPTRVHHQAPQGTIGLDAQIDPAMGHLHRAGQQQPRRHGPTKQSSGEEGEPMPAPGVAAGDRGGDRHHADAACGSGGPQHPIPHRPTHPIWVHRKERDLAVPGQR